MNPDDKPFEVTSQETQNIGDNAPLLPAEPGQKPGPKTDRVLWYTVGGITLAACFIVFLLGYTFIRSSPIFKQPPFVPPPTPRPIVTPNLTATQRAWVKPAQQPTLGNAEEAEVAVNDNHTLSLATYAFSSPPSFPEINQPGDVYLFRIRLTNSIHLLWDYGWCTTTPEILDENFAQMKIEFLLNGTPVTKDRLAITESQRETIGDCRSYTALVKDWPPGQHQLETRVTFLQPTDDGWNLYPQGMHMFKYFVYVE